MLPGKSRFCGNPGVLFFLKIRTYGFNRPQKTYIRAQTRIWDDIRPHVKGVAPGWSFDNSEISNVLIATAPRLDI